MKRTRKPSAALTRIIDSLDEKSLRRLEDRMLVCMDISKHMQEQKVSQTELAARMGKSKSEVSEWLSGERNFTMDTLSDMYSALGIPMMNVLSTHVRMIVSPAPSDIQSSDNKVTTVESSHNPTAFSHTSLAEMLRANLKTKKQIP
jgi:predicted XRE-type DNA-binding protein